MDRPCREIHFPCVSSPNCPRSRPKPTTKNPTSVFPIFVHPPAQFLGFLGNSTCVLGPSPAGLISGKGIDGQKACVFREKRRKSRDHPNPLHPCF